MSDAAALAAVEAGDRLPFCYGMGSDRRFYSLEQQAGRPAVLLVLGAAGACDAALAALLPLAESVAGLGADLVVLGREDAVRAATAIVAATPDIRVVDCNADFLARCVPPDEGGAVFVIDRNQRIALRCPAQPEAGVAAACLQALQRLPSEPAADATMPAPVLLLPNLLSPALCRNLIERFEAGPSSAGEVAGIGDDGLPESRIDHRKKRRLDLLVAPDEPLHHLLRDLLLRRCAPELARAFQARVAYLDRILLARYDDIGGWFRRHRDNVGRNVAFREFALSVNLNGEDHSGGQLLFPEYNDHRHRLPTGAGLIFSASLLHEATPVLRGRRYVLLTFLHGEAAEARRLSYAAEASAALAVA